MKKILIFLLARVFNRFKVRNPVFYASVILPALLWIQTHMFDPDVVTFIQSIVTMLPDSIEGTVASIITWLPVGLIGLTGTHTSEIVEDGKAERRAARQLRKQKDSL